MPATKIKDMEDIVKLPEFTAGVVITRKKDAGGFSGRRWKRNIKRATKRAVRTTACMYVRMYMPLT